MDRQVARLSVWAAQAGLPVVRVETEVGSGMNGARSKARRLLADAEVGVVVVEHRGRLGRLNTELVEAALTATGRRLVVLDSGEVDDDLVRDMVEVLTWFCARLYGRRSGRNRAQRALEAAAVARYRRPVRGERAVRGGDPGPAAGVVSAADAQVLCQVGAYLGSLAGRGLAVRCRDGLAHDKDTWALASRKSGTRLLSLLFVAVGSSGSCELAQVQRLPGGLAQRRWLGNVGELDNRECGQQLRGWAVLLLAQAAPCVGDRLEVGEILVAGSPGR